MSTPVFPAATVLVIRPSAEGPEVLMLRRTRKSTFFPDAWIFPGGRVQPDDADVPVHGHIAGLEDEPSWGVAAVRETFEEAGIWLGEGIPPAGLRERLNRGDATLLDAPELKADLSRLRWMSWWITPEIEPKRYDTRFFLARVTWAEVERAGHCDIETVETRWIRPEDAVKEHQAGRFFLAPPTFVLLEELALELSLPAPHLAGRFPLPTAPILPRLEGGRPNPAGQDEVPVGGIEVVLPGDPTYPTPHPVSGPTRLILRNGAWYSLRPASDDPSTGG